MYPNIETAADYDRYEKAFARGVAEFQDHSFSTGIWTEGDDEQPESEPYFSWRRCDICDRNLGGSREDVIAWLDGARAGGWTDEHKWSGIACEDCVYYNEYGRLDDATMLRVGGEAEPC